MTLEEHLRARLSDHRALIGALNINAERVLIDFGGIGPLARIRLRVRGNEITVVSPEVDDGGAAEALLYGRLAAPPVPPQEPAAGAGQEPAPLPQAPEAATPASDAPVAPEAPPAPKPRVDPDAHSHAELRDLAAAEGVRVAGNASKAVIAAAINTARGH